MKSTVGLFALALLLSACASRTAPFNELDKAPITIMRLQEPPPPPPPVAAVPGLPQIPGVPPELQQLGQQALDGLKAALPPGLIPQPAQPPPQAQLPKFFCGRLWVCL